MAETTKTTTARKTAKAVKLPLTSRKKMGAARGKSAIKAEVKKVREENERAHERRTEACGKGCGEC